ncbi:UbiD family decarboxylase [candidate division KSB1 bacterium]|nr:UbiD family decarboxylase [candidate division KSB1 bacterium]
MNFRECLENENKRGSLQVVSEKSNPNLEVAIQINETEPAPVLFEDVNGLRVAGNLFANRESYARHLNIPQETFLHTLHAKLSAGDVQLEKRDGIYGEIELSEVDLSKLPILYHYQGDGGPYITAGVWIVNDPQFGPNMSYHRMMITGNNRGTVRVVENRGTFNALQHSNGVAEAAICIGAPPAVLLAASCSPDPGINEMELAARLDEVTLVKCKTVDLWVPDSSEIVIEGRFVNETGDEGPFVDITGTWDHIRQQPVFEVSRIAMREDAIYHALVPGRGEHQILMGMPKEIDILREVNNVCRCLDVSITPGGSAWLHAVVQIEKTKASDGKAALEAAFRAHKSLKHCVVVDSDINIHDPHDVEWAIATRLQADRDMMILSDQPSSSLDPSATHIPGKKSRAAKMGMDATIKASGEEKKMFYRVR